MATGSGEQHRTRAFAAGAFEFAVDTATADERLVVESLFRDVPPPSSHQREITLFSMIREDGEARTWAVGGPYIGAEPAPTLANALDRLLGAVNRAALDAEPEYLHLHAAAATKGERAVIVAAQANTGKTTTIAHLVARGWDYVTDESVRLSPDTPEITGLRKPLSIKPGGEALVGHLAPWMIPAAGEDSEGFRFVPIGASGASVATRGLPQLVVLLRRESLGVPTAAPVARPLHPADAVVALMAETFDPERFGPAAVQLATLAASCHCYEITIGTPTETVDEIETLFGLGAIEPLDVGVLPPSGAFSPGVVSVAIGDRAVVHDTASGRVFALDPGAARVWRQLGGWGVDHSIDLHTPAIGPFLAQLRALGVLAGAA